MILSIQEKFCAQRSVGLLPSAAADAAATPERPIATTPLATLTSSGLLRKSGISAPTSVAVHPRASAAAEGRRPRIAKGRMKKWGEGKAEGERRERADV
jgi:hypothetical protein